MANEQNLMSIQEVNSRRTPEQHSKDSSKGGKRSGEIRRQRKTLKEQLELLLSLPVKDEQTRDYIASLGIDPDTIDNATALTLSMYQEGLKGNTKAYELIRDTLGEKPTDKLELEQSPVILMERPKK